MENNQAKNIFGEKEQMSRELMNQALTHGLKLKHELAQVVEQSEFEHDAVEGFDAHGLTSKDLHSLDEKMRRHFEAQNPKNSSFKTFIILWFGAFIGIIISAFIFNGSASNNTLNKYAQTAQQQPKAFPQQSKQTIIEKMKTNTEERFILKPESDPVKTSSQTTTIKEGPSSESKEEMHLQRMSPIQAANLDPVSSKGIIKKRIAKEVMLSGFVFIDYRELRDSKDISEFRLSGTRANQQTRDSAPNDIPDIEKSRISYHEFLKQTADLLKTNNWARAAQNFETILKNYPDDANALFYMGYIKYNQVLFQESLNYLELSEKSNLSNFEHETAWYKLKNYLKLKKTELAVKLAQEIIEGDGFYKKQAEEVLKNIAK